MKYLGEKSVSSFFSRLLAVLWYVVLVLSIFGFIFLIFIIIISSINLPIFTEIAKGMKNDDWEKFRSIPLIAKFFILPYCVALMVLILKIMRTAQTLFRNFEKDIVFNKNNVGIISKIAKLLIATSIMTFNFSTFMVSIILLIICEIFKNGTALQEEHDLTV